MTFLRRLVVLLLVVLGASMGRQAFAQKKIVQRVLRADSIIKTGFRPSDNAPMCFIELVDFDENMAKTAKKTKRTRRSSKKSAEQPAAAAETPAEAPATTEAQAENAE